MKMDKPENSTPKLDKKEFDIRQYLLPGVVIVALIGVLIFAIVKFSGTNKKDNNNADNMVANGTGGETDSESVSIDESKKASKSSNGTIKENTGSDNTKTNDISLTPEVTGKNDAKKTTPTVKPSVTPKVTPVSSGTPAPTKKATVTNTPTASYTPTPTNTPTNTPTPTDTPTPTSTNTPVPEKNIDTELVKNLYKNIVKESLTEEVEYDGETFYFDSAKISFSDMNNDGISEMFVIYNHHEGWSSFGCIYTVIGNELVFSDNSYLSNMMTENVYDGVSDCFVKLSIYGAIGKRQDIYMDDKGNIEYGGYRDFEVPLVDTAAHNVLFDTLNLVPMPPSRTVDLSDIDSFDFDIWITST